MDKKPGRNDPCPCGSGKKYKQCHGSAGAIAEEKKKLYTPAGKRKFKATLLSSMGKSQEIFGQSASTQKMPDQVGAPGALLKFRKTSKDYRVEENKEPIFVAQEEELKEPTAAPKQDVDFEKPFEPTKKDFRKEEKE